MPKQRDRKVEALQDVSGLGRADKELQRLARLAEYAEVEAGSILGLQGDLGREAFLIVSGEVAVIRDGVELARIGAGQFVGELSVLDHAARTATIKAVTDVTVFAFGISAFNCLMEGGWASRKIVKQMGERLRAADDSMTPSA